MKPIGIWVIATATGQPIEGWVSSYDPNGNAGRGALVLTRDTGLAKRFDSHREAWDCYQQVASLFPTRADGRPNRPLTAFTVELTRLEG